jgi:hypothetical protein
MFGVLGIGQGVERGMEARDAATAVRRTGAILLDSYSPERSAVAEMVLRNATPLTDLATLTHPTAQAARNLAFRVLFGFQAVRDKMTTTISEIGIAYAGSPLSSGSLAGERWPPQHYDGVPPGIGSEPRFVLYTADGEKGAALSARFPSLLEPNPRTLEERPHRLLIVRPDGYIGFSSDDAAWVEAERYLQRLALECPVSDLSGFRHT